LSSKKRKKIGKQNIYWNKKKPIEEKTGKNTPDHADTIRRYCRGKIAYKAKTPDQAPAIIHRGFHLLR